MTQGPHTAVTHDLVGLFGDFYGFGSLEIRGHKIFQRLVYFVNDLLDKNLYCENMNVQNIEWCLSETVSRNPEKYQTVDIQTAKLLDLWSSSMVAFEYLQNGTLRSKDDLKPASREKFDEAEKLVRSGKSLPQPLLGIGIYDTLEIATQRALVCVLAAQNVPSIRASLPISMEKKYNKLVK